MGSGHRFKIPGATAFGYWIDNGSSLILIALLFLLPFGFKYYKIPLALWIFLRLIHVVQNPGSTIRFHKSILLLLPVYFIFCVIGYFYKAPPENPIDVLVTRLSFIIIPILFSSISGAYMEKMSWFIKAFVFGCIIASLMNLLRIWTYISENELLFFDFVHSYFLLDKYPEGHRVVSFIHPSYFALYSVFSITLIWLNKRIFAIGKINKNLLAFIISLPLIFFIYILQSRAGFISFVLATGILLIPWVRKKQFFLRLALILVVLLLGITFTIKEGKYQSLVNITNKISETGTLLNDKTSADELRLWLWYSTVELIKEKPLLGYGINNSAIVLKEKYKEIELWKGYYNDLNPHNQYLQTWIELGFMGFLILMLILILPIVYSIKYKNYLLMIFIISFANQLVFESMLVRIDGIAYFVIFYCLLALTQNTYLINNSRSIKSTAILV